MKILGLAYDANHESSVALVEDGKILFTTNEERYSRIKMDERAPVLALKECLKQTGVSPNEIDIIAFSGFPPPKNWYFYAGNFLARKVFTRGKDFFVFDYRTKGKEFLFKNFSGLLVNLALCTGVPQFLFLFLVNRIKVNSILKGFKGKVVYVPHHECHAASACFTSGFDDCLSIVIEGSDWENSFVIDEFKEGSFKNISKTPYPHSPGYFYELATTILGFNPRRHAGKITGLAAFGDATVAYGKVAKLIWAENLSLKVSPLIYTLGQDYLLSKEMPSFFRGYSRENIASAFQKRLEDTVVEVVNRAVVLSKKNKIVLSGGVAGNVLLNQKIHEIDGVKEVFVHPAMSDSGQALGAALYAYNAELKNGGSYLKSHILKNVYFGSEYSNAEIKKVLENKGLEHTQLSNIEKEIARLLVDKKVIGRFNGRMEYGPRALGNRSILSHAGDKSINDWLNKRLKRTEFMPFAPSVLFEDKDRYFKNTEGAEYTSKFMTITFNCTEEMIRTCPAVVYVDGTARPNFVHKEDNLSYYNIIKEYSKLTGISTILNTSFNMHEEPIVCTPQDAIKSFLSGGVDYLAIGDFLVKNKT